MKIILIHYSLVSYSQYFINLGFQCLFSKQIEHESFEKLVKFYLDTDVQIVIAELKLWQSKLKIIDKFPKTAIDALRLCNFEFFPNIYYLLKILCTLPVSTSTPERTFSCLKRLKIYLRNTMTEVNSKFIIIIINYFSYIMVIFSRII